MCVPVVCIWEVRVRVLQRQVTMTVRMSPWLLSLDVLVLVMHIVFVLMVVH